MAGPDVRRTTGLVLGKFLPPTRGHQYLVDFARNYADDLTVIVGSIAREPIPGSLRFDWMRELFPGVSVVHLTDENPQYPGEHPEFWRIWHDSIRKFVPQGPDYVFASEDYGFKLAEVLGSKYIPVDHGRALVPVSATQVRGDPMAHWAQLPDCVRPHFVRRVCVIGPESTGKTVLAGRLAAHFGTKLVAEYARGYIDLHGGPKPEDFAVFARAQAASELALARQANRVLICDSDVFTTALYHELYVGGCPQYLTEAAEASRYDLYLLTCPDTPYVADAQRNHPGRRDWFFRRCRERLDGRKARYAVIKGGWEERFAAARAAVEELVTAGNL